MSRRELLRLLAVLGLSLGSLGWANGKDKDKGNGNDKDKDKDNGNDKDKDKDKGNDKDKDKDKGNDKDKGDKSSPGNPNNPEPRRNYYARVTLNDGAAIYCGGTRVFSDSPWLKLAAPGMWLEAEGNWNEKDFKAAQVKIVSPKVWAYYQGPAAALSLGGAQRVEVWLQDGAEHVLFQRTLTTSANTVRVVAYHDGTRFLAVPPNLIAAPGLKPGWYKLNGTWNGQAFTWSSIKPFPGDEE